VVAPRAIPPLDDEPATARAIAEPQRHERLQRAHVRPERGVDRRLSRAERHIPERPAEGHRQLVAPEVEDENVEPPLLALDPRGQAGHILILRVIGANGDADTTQLRHHGSGLLDGFGSAAIVAGNGWGSGDAASGAIDRGARLAEHAGDPAPGATRGPGDDGDAML